MAVSRPRLLLLIAVPAWLLCVTLYRSHRLCSGRVVFDASGALPSYAYLLFRSRIRALRKKRGRLYPSTEGVPETGFAVVNCRIDTDHLRQYCSAAGYGWDYPDSAFRDIPLLYPAVLCSRLFATIVSSAGFRLSPLGLLCLQQTVRKLQPVDELKKGPFQLQASVSEYRPVSAGVEVDVSFKAVGDAGPVWESQITLLSPKTKHLQCHQDRLTQADGTDAGTRVEIRVSWSTGLRWTWTLYGHFLKHLLWIQRPTAYGLWMQSQCLAEVEKHKGADAVRAPVSVHVLYRQPLVLPGRASIRIWEDRNDASFPAQKACRFQMEDPKTRDLFILGEVRS
ncbi:uncharacterized protein LOC114799529 [Denticeps clupeoides]|uniref:uncharacterized protein LOC114799529 n=1 Tax=Denticeps clupeoides TaxID=299321 RepID=UPI0010A32053|nr:uncharacterized protein LOC114799529 [Denticeps clupeoides]XP_028852094.1 uncharacterized protein LOC114799529 [Denticeps clupeoides]XP_028852095.1 uncharacterized protein LOC114799529 [Denticeps clupeoides]